jgi:hypothetical protein
MPTALLYFRTDGTHPVYTASTTSDAVSVSQLLATYPDQVLEFDFPENILEGMKLSYDNNVVNIPAPNSDGVKLINKQENGLRGVELVINGVFKNPKTINTDITKLKNLATMSQVDSKHIYGIVGFYSPNAPEFSLDPNATVISTATKGYTLSSFTIGYVGQNVTRYDFRVTLSFGGTYTS